MGLRTAARLFALGCAALTGSAAAQINLPALRLPSLPASGLTGPLTQTVGNGAQLGPAALMSARRASAQALIRQNRQLIEADPNGEPMLRGELVAFELGAQALDHVIAAGFELLGGQPPDRADAGIQVLRAPPGMSTARALRRLRELEPAVAFDYDHLYGRSASGVEPATAMPATADGAARAAPDPDALRQGGVRVGLIDGGVQVTHSVFHEASITLSGCDGRPVPSSHATAIASLLVGAAAPFLGAAPGARLYAADVYCGQPTGGAVDAIAAAFAWLDAQRVAVINISLVGPDNQVLRQVVRQMIERGHIVVAAVGNDGPAAAPLYPAAYPDVVGVTAVDAQRRVLLEAARGSQVEFAAPGADGAAARCPQGYASVRGTSFAAPLVAGLLAPRLPAPDPQQARAAIDSLAREAIHLGAGGRNPSYGFGLVAEGLRTAPDIMQAGSKTGSPAMEEKPSADRCAL
jgi:subtilisin family serine protease